MGFMTDTYRAAVIETTERIDWSQVELAVTELIALRERGGRLFILGLGGSAGNAGHMTNDMRKLAGIESYAPTDNVSELTARINDDGWGQAFTGWLKASRFSSKDAIFVLSVGGGDAARGVSTELVNSVDYAASLGSVVLGIVGRDGGHAAEVSDKVIVIPPVDPALITPVSEAFQAVVWHGMACHPELAAASAHWESLATK